MSQSDIIYNVCFQEEDRRTVSICESIATTVTATSDVDNNFSDDEGRMSDDSGTASAPSPSPLPTDDKGKMVIGWGGKGLGVIQKEQVVSYWPKNGHIILVNYIGEASPGTVWLN